ncbi:unnamed protein product [Calicophoron daubneyi]|uniref:glutathione transferase n=1 Tax=Calicophoron daubneyi TaxID=300641 RepID=A0AAV2TPD7_CALDB
MANAKNKSATYKLTYFNVRGRGEPIRFVLAATGTPFDDKRVEGKDWPALKPSIPTHRLPYLQLTSSSGDIVGYEESLAIARYLARKHNLMGQTDEEYYKIERMIGECNDIDTEFYKIAFPPSPEAQGKLKDAFLKEQGPKLLDMVSRSLKESGGKFVAGGKPSFGDFMLMTVMDHVDDIDPDILKKYPEFSAHRAAVLQEFPKLAEYIKTRPHTTM